MRPRLFLPMVGALSALNPITQALAQEPQSGSARLEEVLVTAQKRSERLIDVPVAITSIDSDSLIDQNLVSLTDYYNRIPGLQIGGNTSAADINDFSLRGITTGGGTNPTLAILVNDVQFGGTNANAQAPIPDFDPATIERVEILRGPQGTLYGASSLGGLIKYVLRDPSPDETYGRVEAGVSSYDGGDEGYSARGSLNVPIVDEKLALSLSGVYRDDAAYMDNVGTTPPSSNVNTLEVKGGSASLLYRPTDNLQFTLSALTQKQEQGSGNRIEIVSETDFDQVDGYDLDTLNEPESGMDREFEQYIGRIDWDFDWATLTSITGYGESTREQIQDVTYVFGPVILGLVYPEASPDSNITILNDAYTEKFTQELRLSGDTESFNWLAGVFYTDEDSSLDQTLVLNDPASASTPFYIGEGPSGYEEKAVFADFTFFLTDKIDLQVGGRYSDNEQYNIASATIDEPAQIIFGPSFDGDEAKSSESAFTWLVSPSYQFNDDMMAYLRVASGYRPGGPNPALPNISRTFDSDEVVNYELGFKGYISDNLTLDTAIFYIDWEDIQLQNSDTVSQFVFFTNGSKARSRGLEVALQWTPQNIDGLSISANATYTDAELTEDIPEVDGATSLNGKDGDPLPYTPDFTFNLSARQVFSISSRLDGSIGASYTYTDDRPSELLNIDATRPRYTLPSYDAFDLTAGLVLDAVWKVNFYARNIFDERGVVTSSNRNGTAAPNANFTAPRMYGINFVREF